MIWSDKMFWAVIFFCIVAFVFLGLIIKDYYDFKKILKQAEEANVLLEKVTKETVEILKMTR